MVRANYSALTKVVVALHAHRLASSFRTNAADEIGANNPRVAAERTQGGDSGGGWFNAFRRPTCVHHAITVGRAVRKAFRAHAEIRIVLELKRAKVLLLGAHDFTIRIGADQITGDRRKRRIALPVDG